MSSYSTHLTVAVICKSNDRFLMVEEKPTGSDTLVINQPAGHIEAGETIINAAVRETLEETGHIFSPEALLGIYHLNTQGHKAYYRICFIGSAELDKNNPTIDPDISAVHWLSSDEILNHPRLRSPLVHQCMQDYLDGIRFPLSLIRQSSFLS